ncbi:MAG: extracellular solute-binding protein [Clostridia bacterium]|nr:extracellular solute-binding protein [Clostridia bacterium]
MKKTTLARLLALLLVAVMAVSVLAACGGSGDGNGDGEEKIDFQGKPELDPKIEKQDYNGYEFTFVCQPYLSGNAYSVNYMVSDGETQNVLLDAVYRRNELLKQKYNIDFKQLQVTDLITTVRTQVMGGEVEFDMIVGTCKGLATLAKENLLLDLSSVDRFDMTKEYWDGNAAEQLKIGEKLYFTNCDLNVQEVAFVVYFNKQMIENENLTSPYEYMKNNEWTLDNWANLVMAVSDDVTGEGEMTELDKYGTLYENHNGRMFLYGVGVRATTNDESGYPKVTLFDTDKTVNTYEKCKQVFSSASSWSIDGMPNSETHGYNDKWDYARSLFCQDLYLFHYEGTNIIHQFADMESEFGIVPFPKYDKNQAEYYSMYPINCAMVAIPNIDENLERTANIVEDLNYYSNVLLKPAWYDQLLSRRYVRDDESEDSLDIILAGRVYDVGMYYNFGGIKDILNADVTKTNISTSYARIKKAVDADIKTTYRDFGLV